MRAKTKLEWLRRLRERDSQAQGFTLIELMIILAILGIIASIALPQYLLARNAVTGSSAIGELVNKANECSTYVLSGGLGVPPILCTSSTASVIISCSWNGTANGLLPERHRQRRERRHHHRNHHRCDELFAHVNLRAW